jgi:hypothetical protein
MADQLRQRRQQDSSIAKDEYNGETTRAEGDQETLQVVRTSAPPPWHSSLLIFAFFGLFIWTLPNVDMIDEIANRATIANSVSSNRSRSPGVCVCYLGDVN